MAHIEKQKQNEFDELLLSCRISVERFIHFKVQNTHDADDIIQNTYLSAYKNFDTLKNKSSFKSWILQIAKNECGMFYRKIQNRVEIPVDEVPEAEVFYTTGDSSDAISDKVAEVILRMPEKHSRILQMFFMENKSYAQIADEVRIPEGTVKSRLYHAKKLFRAMCPDEIKLYYQRGNTIMNTKRTLNFPAVMPEVKITKKDVPFFSVREKFIAKVGDKSVYADYRYPEREIFTVSTIYVPKTAVINGVTGVKVCQDTYNAVSDHFLKNVAVWFTQMTDEYVRILARINCDELENYPTEIFTFLDEKFDVTCNGNDRVHGLPVLIEENPACEDDYGIHFDVYNIRYTMGVYDVSVGQHQFETIRVLNVQENRAVATEQYIDKSGRTVLTRSYKPGKFFEFWSEERKAVSVNNAVLTINGDKYIHLMDRIEDFTL